MKRTTFASQDLSCPGGRTQIVVILLAVAGIGYFSAVAPEVSLAVIAATGVVTLLALGRGLNGLAFITLLVLLTGYAFLGKGFAYLGIPPLYVGELVLALLLLSFLVVPRTQLSGSHLIILAFMAWGLLRTIPYLTTYGVEALRDAVIWGYALFAILVSLTLTAAQFRTVIHWYCRLLPWLVFWIPIGGALYFFLGNAFPKVPGTSVPFMVFKPGDYAVHSAAIAVFVITGLWAAGSPQRRISESMLWPTWLVGMLILGSMGRGGLVAAIASLSTAVLLRPSRRWLWLAASGFVIAIFLLVTNPTVDVGGSRKISPRQITANVMSIISSNDDDPLQGTKQWRLEWWKKIVSYTFHGPYFLTGKGFGINLANDDGFQVLADESLRSPHNGHLTILARMGVPGILLWIGLQGTVGLSLIRGALQARRRGHQLWSAVMVWLLSYWLALLVNASFDVYLEGPQGGIWFWTIVGLAITALRLEREATSDLDLSPQPQPVRHARLAHP